MLKIGEYDAYDSMALKQELRKRFRVNNRFSRDILKYKVFDEEFDIADEFKTDPELIAIRTIFT